jgi:DNA replication protein DnaC
MTTGELDRALRQLRLGGIADTLDVRAQQARADSLGPLDFLGLLVHDELNRRRDRLVERRMKLAAFRDRKTLDTLDWKFNTSIDRALVFELATGRFIEQRQDCLILGNPGCGKSHIAQGIGMAGIHAGFRVIYREAHILFEELVLAAAIGERAQAIETYSEIPLLIIDLCGVVNYVELASMSPWVSHQARRELHIRFDQSRFIHSVMGRRSKVRLSPDAVARISGKTWRSA